MSGARISYEGRSLTLDELELARGRRELKVQLRNLRQSCPSLKLLVEGDPLPFVQVEVNVGGARCPVLVDPLRLWDRLGLPRELPDWLETKLAEQSGDWLEVN